VTGSHGTINQFSQHPRKSRQHQLHGRNRKWECSSRAFVGREKMAGMTPEAERAKKYGVLFQQCLLYVNQPMHPVYCLVQHGQWTQLLLTAGPTFLSHCVMISG